MTDRCFDEPEWRSLGNHAADDLGGRSDRDVDVYVWMLALEAAQDRG